MSQQKRIYILTLIFVITFGWAMVLTFGGSGSGEEDNRKIAYDTTSINQIQIVADTGKILLTRNGKSWTVNNQYRVRTDLQQLLLAALARLEVKRNVAKENIESTKQIIRKRGYQVSINGKPEFTLAANENDANSSYLLKEGEAEPLVVHVPGFTGSLSDLLKQDESVWRTHELFRSSPLSIQRIKAEYPAIPNAGFEIRYVGPRQFEIVGMNAIDTASLYAYLEQFQQVNVEQFIYKNKNEILQKLSSEKPVCILQLEDLNPELSQTIIIYGPSKVRSAFYCILKERNELVTLTEQTLNRIIARKEFFAPKKD